MTLDQFVPIYIERGPQASGKTTWKDDQYLLGTLRTYLARDGRRLGDWSLSAITEDELEAFHAIQRTAGRAASTLNHLVQVIKAAFRWAVRKGYLPRSPISDDSALKRTKPAQRTRRITPDEETKLLAAAGALTRGAGVRLSGLIVAALETGCRRGELLGLLWGDVNVEKKELTIRAENAKDRDIRTIPISTRLAAVLDMAKIDPAGRGYPADAFVFGLLGEPVASIKRAWETAVLDAYGHKPEYVGTRLSVASRTALHAIDLHFHDLRHEAGSRWLESGMPLHHVKELLGHANISQTDTYLNAGRLALHDSMKRFDAVIVSISAMSIRTSDERLQLRMHLHHASGPRYAAGDFRCRESHLQLMADEDRRPRRRHLPGDDGFSRDPAASLRAIARRSALVVQLEQTRPDGVRVERPGFLDRATANRSSSFAVGQISYSAWKASSSDRTNR